VGVDSFGVGSYRDWRPAGRFDERAISIARIIYSSKEPEMRFKGKALLAGVLAATLLSALSASSSARNFSLSNASWTSVYGIEVAGGFGRVRCPSLTLSGSFHSRTLAKVRESLVGYVTSAGGNGFCSGLLSVRVLTERLPWHVRYIGFSGLLPNISSAGWQIIGFEYLVTETAFGIRCLLRSTTAQPINTTWSREASGRIVSSSINGSITSDCGINFTLSGGGSVSPATTLTLI
jgi:hypothetical protein